MITIALIPALAAYAAAEADVFPVDAHITAFDPDSTAFVRARVMPLSLNEPVGFDPSNLKYRSRLRPILFLRFKAFISGVFPSFRVMTCVLSVTGRKLL